MGRTVDLRAKVDDLHIPTEASEPCHDAGDGVLAVVGGLGVPDGLVLALEDDLAVLVMSKSTLKSTLTSPASRASGMI